MNQLKVTRREALTAAIAAASVLKGVQSMAEIVVAPTAGEAEKWAAPWRGWHYWPDHVISAEPKISGYLEFKSTDGPCVYRIPGSPLWHISFLGFNGHGYNTFTAESDDLIHWRNGRLAFGFGPPNEFDHGGRVLGAYLFTDYNVRGSRLLKKREGRYWSLYGCYPLQGGYELRPGYEGVASSTDGLTWDRAKQTPTMSIYDKGCDVWEKDCIYQPWLLEHKGQFLDFYNAARTACPEPLYRAGEHPDGLDATYAHKTSLTYNPNNGVFYLHYCAVGNKGRGIGLLTSKPLPM